MKKKEIKILIYLCLEDHYDTADVYRVNVIKMYVILIGRCQFEIFWIFFFLINQLILTIFT